MAKTREDYLRYEAAARTLAEAAETAEEREYFLGRAALHRSRAEGSSPAGRVARAASGGMEFARGGCPGCHRQAAGPTPPV